MKILFNLHSVGLGNNGGSQNIIRCADILTDIGHDVVLYSNGRNRCTWKKIEKAEYVCSKYIPDSDVIIATGYHSVPSTLLAKCSKKFYYVRGFELWQASEKDLLASYKTMPCLVNSEWLQWYMITRGISAELVYLGLDFSLFYKENIKRKITLGGLYHTKHKTKNHDEILKIAEKVGCDVSLLNRDIVSPDPIELRFWYNTIKIWVAASTLEGLHNPPMEAALCGCSLLCSNAPRGGTSDYGTNNETATIYPQGDISYASEKVLEILETPEKQTILNNTLIQVLNNKIGSKKYNMEKLSRFLEGIL